MIILSNLEAATIRGGSEHPWDSDRTEIQNETLYSEHPWDRDYDDPGVVNLS